MLRLALRGLLARKLRTALTALAVVAGVAFVAGTFVFTDTIDASFKDLFQRASKGVDIAATPRQVVGRQDGPGTDRTLPASALAKVRGLEGVEEAVGRVDATVHLLRTDGTKIGSHGAPTFLNSAVPSRFDPLDYKAGGPPQGPDDVVLNQATADKQGLHVGDQIVLAGLVPAKRYRISGTATLGDVANLGGAGFATLTVPEAQRVAGLGDAYSEVDAAASRGTDPAVLKGRVEAALGRAAKVQTGQEQADQQAKDIAGQLGFLTTALLVFAGVALLVGGFLIFNTFSVTVAQRSRELALLRTLGASRGQLLRSVMAESLAIGVVASVVGILAGVALAPALRALLAAFGLDLPNTGTVLAPRTILAGLAVGVVATLVSGFVPARRATRVDPIEAMREGAAPSAPRLRRRRLAAAAALGALGIAALCLGLFAVSDATGAASLMGIGAVLVMFGVALLAPVLVRPLARAIGRPLERVQGLPGRLARENAARQPQRTAVTASALMIGLALVVFVAIFAAGLRASVTSVVDEQVRAQLVVTSDDGFSPLPRGVEPVLARTPGVDAVSPLLFAASRVRGVPGTTSASGVDPATLPRALALKWAHGSDATLAALRSGGAVVEDGWASKHRLGVGSTLQVTTPTGRVVPYRVAGTFDNKLGLTGTVLVAADAMRRDWGVKDDAVVFAAARPGTDPAALQRAAKAGLGGFPVAKPQTVAQFKDDQAKQVGQIVGLIYALLSLSVIVALLGIVNTLALSVHERTRELGMLRAVGMSRRQMRRMVRAEAVITALIGAVLGLLLGAALAALVSRPLADQGFRLSFPVATLVVLAVLAALAGVVAAIPPARRAARVDVLRAVTAE